MMMRRYCIVLVLYSLTGCAGSMGYWAHPTKSITAAWDDTGYCGSVTGPPLADWEEGSAARWHAFRTCMQTRGWYEVARADWYRAYYAALAEEHERERARLGGPNRLREMP